MPSIDTAHATAWLDRYGRAWESADPQAAAALFSAGCLYFETPYSEPARGRDGVARYWQNVPDAQTDVRFGYRVLAIVERTVYAHWTASFTRKSSGARVELDGMFALAFDEAGLCRELREWWHRRETPVATE